MSPRNENNTASAPQSPSEAKAIQQTNQGLQPRPKRSVSKGSRSSSFNAGSGRMSLPAAPVLTRALSTHEVPKAAAAPGMDTPIAALPEGPSPSLDGTSWIDAREGYQLMAMHLWRAFKRDCLFGQTDGATGIEVPSGVAIRYGKGQYVVCPSNDERLSHFCHSVAVLNTEAAMTLTSAVVAAITTRLAHSMTHVPITPSQNIQVVDTMQDLAAARKAQNACFIRLENTLVVWADQVEILRERAKDLEDRMITLVWNSSYKSNLNNVMVATKSGASTPALASPSALSPSTSATNSIPSSPTTSSFTSISSTALSTALNQTKLEKTARNHKRSYTRESPYFFGTGTAIAPDDVSDAENGESKEVIIDSLANLPASPMSVMLRPNSHVRHVSFSDRITESDSAADSAILQVDAVPVSTSRSSSFSRAAASIRKPETAKIDTWPSESTSSSLANLQSKSSRSSMSSSGEIEQRWDDGMIGELDYEKQTDEYEQRPLSYIAPVQHGLAVALDLLICFLFTSKLFEHSLRDGNWSRMALTPIMLVMFPVILFFCDNIIGIIIQIIGPVNQLHQNSLYYSGKAPERKLTGELPHVTIQMPVYKESLQGVLMPTIESVKKAITTYELQGGTAGIVVSEDGMLLVDEQEQTIRKEFYERNNVGWVARPGHNKDGYVRKGRFKKASNLNFTCHLSVAVEKMMDEQRPDTFAQLRKFHDDPCYLKLDRSVEQGTGTGTDGETHHVEEKAEITPVAEDELSQALGPQDWTDADETELYRRCLEACLAKMHPLAQAKGNIRIGQLVLMIDSDTRVPEDCLLDAATEMTLSPEIGVLQHCSGVMLVSDSYFELCIAFFTRLVNFAISFTVANGDVAPFMGHNAILRWSAMQEAAFIDPEDGVLKYWSESHVSEDFDMALRLLMSGYITRWATYSNNGFEEGVSLTCDDELNRWQKYAFGCSELVLHRLWEWPFKGPFTPLFKTFLCSSAPIHYKFSASSYIFSYYAIAAAFPMTWTLYLIEGWYYPVLDPSFLTPFRIWVAVVVVFTIGGNVSQIIARYRTKVDSLFNLIKEHAAWMPAMFVFFGGLSYHVCTALLSHPLGIDMTWGATNKDLADSNFFLEVPLIWKRFWRVILLCTVTIAAVVIMQITAIVPLSWSIQGFFTYWPLLLTAISHLIYPIVLNPALLRFSF